MKLETNIVYLDTGDRDYANIVSGWVFNSIEELKEQFDNDGINIRGIQLLHEFQDEWNDTDDDMDGLKDPLMTSMITYIHIVKW
tara:strand:- start:428 stop:679 length:252 start_codon:yes stop_codon:yes gene_type:complete